MFVGRRVRTVVQVQRNESGVLAVQSTDGHQLTIRGAPGAPETPHYIEVMGIPDSNQSIRAESWTDFGENFGEIYCVVLYCIFMTTTVNCWYVLLAAMGLKFQN
jgi:hypothetical protein